MLVLAPVPHSVRPLAPTAIAPALHRLGVPAAAQEGQPAVALAAMRTHAGARFGSGPAIATVASPRPAASRSPGRSVLVGALMAWLGTWMLVRSVHIGLSLRPVPHGPRRGASGDATVRT